MPAETPSYSLPYPVPDDPVADYPAIGRDLAETLAGHLGAIEGTSVGGLDSWINASGAVGVGGGLGPNNVQIAYLVAGTFPGQVFAWHCGSYITGPNSSGFNLMFYLNGVLIQNFAVPLRGQFVTTPLFYGLSPGQVAVLYGYDASTIPQGDWGSYFAQNYIRGDRIRHMNAATREAPEDPLGGLDPAELVYPPVGCWVPPPEGDYVPPPVLTLGEQQALMDDFNRVRGLPDFRLPHA